MRHSNAIGYSVLALAQCAISVNVILSKHLISSAIPMFVLLASRFGLSVVLLATLLKVTRTPLVSPLHPQQKLTLQDWGYAMLQGILAGFLFNVLFVWGLQQTTATAAGIVGSSLPIMVALSAVWLLKERLNLVKVIALLLAVLGILVINLDQFNGTPNIEHSFFGDFLVFLAMVPEAWYSIVSRKLAGRITPLGAAFIANVVAFVTLFPCALLSSTFDFSQISLLQMLMITMASISSLMFFWAWGWGLGFIPASTAALFGGVMPVATALLAICFLHEHLQWYDSLGMLLVISSILIGTGVLKRRQLK